MEKGMACLCRMERELGSHAALKKEFYCMDTHTHTPQDKNHNQALNTTFQDTVRNQCLTKDLRWGDLGGGAFALHDGQAEPQTA